MASSTGISASVGDLTEDEGSLNSDPGVSDGLAIAIAVDMRCAMTQPTIFSRREDVGVRAGIVRRKR